MEIYSNNVKMEEIHDEEIANDNNAAVMKRQAEDVWNKMQRSPMSAEALDKIIPANAEFYKGLIEVVNKQIESDDNQYKDYVSLMKSCQDIIAISLKDGQISKEERTEIIKVLGTLSQNMAMVEINRKKQDGKTKRVFGICAAAFAAIAAIVVAREA